VIIRAAEPADVGALIEVERAAGALFVDVGMPEIAADDPGDDAWFRRFMAAGHAWVAQAAGDDAPAGYLAAEPLDGALHVEQVSVHPRAARRGVGRRLIEHAAGVAAAEGRTALTLTTFTEVPWNAPYYARLGFAVVPPAEWGPGLRAVVAREAAHGLDRWPRVCLRRPL